MISAGLLVLCYTTLNPIVFWMVVSLYSFCTFGFVVTVMWALGERWVYQQHMGRKWLADILSAHIILALDWIPVDWLFELGSSLAPIWDALATLALLPFRWLFSGNMRPQAEYHPPADPDPGVFGLVESTLMALGDKKLRRKRSLISGHRPPVIEDNGIEASKFWHGSNNPDGAKLHFTEAQGGHIDMIRLVVPMPSLNILTTSFPQTFII